MKDVLTTDDEVMIMAVSTYDALVETVKKLSDNLSELEATLTPAQKALCAEWQVLAAAFHECAEKAHYARKA